MKKKQTKNVMGVEGLEYNNTIDCCNYLGENNLVGNIAMLHYKEAFVKTTSSDPHFSSRYSMVTITGGNKRLYIIRPTLATTMESSYEKISGSFKNSLIKNLCKDNNMRCCFLGPLPKLKESREAFLNSFINDGVKTSYDSFTKLLNDESFKDKCFSDKQGPQTVYVIYDWQALSAYIGCDLRRKPVERYIGYFWELIHGNFPFNTNSILIFDNNCAGAPNSFHSHLACSNIREQEGIPSRIEVEV